MTHTPESDGDTTSPAHYWSMEYYGDGDGGRGGAPRVDRAAAVPAVKSSPAPRRGGLVAAVVAGIALAVGLGSVAVGQAANDDPGAPLTTQVDAARLDGGPVGGRVAVDGQLDPGRRGGGPDFRGGRR